MSSVSESPKVNHDYSSFLVKLTIITDSTSIDITEDFFYSPKDSSQPYIAKTSLCSKAKVRDEVWNFKKKDMTPII